MPFLGRLDGGIKFEIINPCRTRMRRMLRSKMFHSSEEVLLVSMNSEPDGFLHAGEITMIRLERLFVRLTCF